MAEKLFDGTLCLKILFVLCAALEFFRQLNFLVYCDCVLYFSKWTGFYKIGQVLWANSSGHNLVLKSGRLNV